MRASLISAAAGAALLTPLPAAAPARATGPCPADARGLRFQKIIDMRHGRVLPSSARFPRGGMTGRLTRHVHPKVEEDYEQPYGKPRTYAFAEKATICVYRFGPGGTYSMGRSDLKGLRGAVAKPRMNPQWGLRLDERGKITLAYQIFHP